MTPELLEHMRDRAILAQQDNAALVAEVILLNDELTRLRRQFQELWDESPPKYGLPILCAEGPRE